MINFKKPLTGSDLILKEQEPFAGYTRATVTVTLAAASKLTLGAPLVRAKGVDGAKYVPLTAAAQLVATNEVAFYLADTLGQFLEIGPGPAGDVTCAAIVRGEIILKDKAIKDAAKVNFAAFADADFAKLKEMAATQHIIIEKVLGA